MAPGTIQLRQYAGNTCFFHYVSIKTSMVNVVENAALVFIYLSQELPQCIKKYFCWKSI